MKVTTMGALVLVLLLAGCQNLPYYDETLDWFSWSRYDSEVDAIEKQIPPPGALQAQPAAPGDQATLGVRASGGGYVYADPPTGTTVSLGATPAVNRNAGGVTLADGSGAAQTNLSKPLVGVRNSIAPSVTWRSVRGAP